MAVIDHTSDRTSNVTRGQLSKIDQTQRLQRRTERAAVPGRADKFNLLRVHLPLLLSTRNIINGYACGGSNRAMCTTGEPAVLQANANATRGQASKIVSNTFSRNASALRPAAKPQPVRHQPKSVDPVTIRKKDEGKLRPFFFLIRNMHRI